MLPEGSLKGIGLKIEKLMLVKWGFESLKYCKKGEILYGDFLISMGYLLALGLLFLFLTYFHLWFVEEEI